MERQGVGELSISRDFATARPFAEVSGTSFAAPRVANAAARIFAEHPDASADLCRAMLVAHARMVRRRDAQRPGLGNESVA